MNYEKIKDSVAVLIPAYEPDENLINMTNELLNYFANIIIVNDGSGEDSINTVFSKLPKEVTLLTHEVNMGKGKALKTGYQYIKDSFTNISGIITADADGQHSINDILKCSEAFTNNDDCSSTVIFGCRDFSSKSKIPPRSRFGNQLTSKLLKSLCKIELSDTQTGLRIIPFSHIDDFLNTKGDRYEYEMNCIMTIKSKGLNLIEVPIEVIYLDNNSSSHFNPIVDSYKIYRVFFGQFLRFCLSSVGSFLVDIILFTVFCHLLKISFPAYYIYISTAGARIISGIFNYSMNRLVFSSKEKVSSSFSKYFILWLVQMCLSALLVNTFYGLIHFNETLIKMIVDTVLFLISYKIQKNWVFK